MNQYYAPRKLVGDQIAFFPRFGIQAIIFFHEGHEGYKEFDVDILVTKPRFFHVFAVQVLSFPGMA